MWPLCSSMRATPLKIITTARRSVHTLMGSKEAFRTKTRAFMVEADITRARRKVSKIVLETRAVRQVLGTGGRNSLIPAELIRSFDESAQISRLHNRMTGIWRYMYFCLRPGTMQVPGTGHRADHVISSLNDHPRNMTDLADVFDQIVFGWKETIVHEVVTFNARKCFRECRLGESFDRFRIEKES